MEDGRDACHSYAGKHHVAVNWPCGGCDTFRGSALSESQDRSSIRQIVAVLILLVLLVGGGLWLTHALRGAATIQDCVSAGRTNCAPIQN